MKPSEARREVPPPEYTEEPKSKADTFRDTDQPVSKADMIRLFETVTVQGELRGVDGNGGSLRPTGKDHQMTFSEKPWGIEIYAPPYNGHKAEKVRIYSTNIKDIKWFLE